METLQRKLVDEKRGQLIYFPPSHVGSIGFFGMPGLTVGWSPATIEKELPTLRIIQSQRHTAHDLRPVAAGFRNRELEWRRTHADVLRAYANEWVALEGEEIVAHGGDPIQVVTEARAKGIQTPYVFYVEPTTEDVAMIGL
ncbi:MAG: hypothetical protein IH857_08035 [Deltaproteobacteria bacterium]|nr:hypothetical protein [Deltaproteobacteria bacterium]